MKIFITFLFLWTVVAPMPYPQDGEETTSEPAVPPGDNAGPAEGDGEKNADEAAKPGDETEKPADEAGKPAEESEKPTDQSEKNIDETTTANNEGDAENTEKSPDEAEDATDKANIDDAENIDGAKDIEDNVIDGEQVADNEIESTTSGNEDSDTTVDEVKLTLAPDADIPEHVITDKYGIALTTENEIAIPLKGGIVRLVSENYVTRGTMPATKPNCLCLTRGPLSLFKLRGNLHFKNLKVKKVQSRLTTTEEVSTLCPPCDCSNCFTSDQDATTTRRVTICR